ncbi:hypothetical protein [Cellulomonas soli]
MIRALSHPVYRRLFVAQVVALAGTGLATVALGLLAYDLAGPRAGAVLGTALAIKMVAYVVVAPSPPRSSPACPAAASWSAPTCCGAPSPPPCRSSAPSGRCTC